MKFKSLKLITGGIMVVAACVFMQACSGESGNNSSATPVNGADTSGATTIGNLPAVQPEVW